MQSSQETRSWQRLVALAVVSGLTLLLYNYAVSHLISGPTFTGSVSSYIWFVVFSGFGFTCVAFIFSFADASMRNAVLRGIGVSAVLTGASLGLNLLFIHPILSQVALPSSRFWKLGGRHRRFMAP